MEFKYNKSAQEALAQIDSKGYLLPYKADERKLYKVRVNFSGKSRTLEDWIIEEGQGRQPAMRFRACNIAAYIKGPGPGKTPKPRVLFLSRRSILTA